MSLPDPQDSSSPLYTIVDTQPTSPEPCTPDSSLSHFTYRQFTPDSITATLPIVVTKSSHGLINALSVRATKFTPTTGMQQLNNRSFYVQRATVDTFTLVDSYGVYIDGTGYTDYISGGQLTSVGELVVNPAAFPPAGVPAFPPV